jgi:hypothetical protein
MEGMIWPTALRDFVPFPRLLHVHRSPCIKIHHHSLSVMRRRQGMENGMHAKNEYPALWRIAGLQCGTAIIVHLHIIIVCTAGG